MMKVIKLGGRVQSNPDLFAALSAMWQKEPGSFCVVHGGGDEISSLQRALGREPTFTNGRRVTTDEDVDLVRMILSGSANKRLVSSLAAAGIAAVGISGEDAMTLLAEPIDREKFGKSGKPVKVNKNLIQVLLDSSFLPVISPVATSAGGEALNVNGDDAAAVIAAALSAELWLVADVAGVLDHKSEVIEELDETAVDALVAAGTVNSGMQAKLEAGFAALNAGARKVKIAGLEALSGNESGTLLSLTSIMT
ncbi:MAG TPA: acetylglutamate kinase [Gemmatimonadaceae bacterium]|nr:acetylglutamate kinase [Gemmatimonadaceae bacterium]